VQALLGKISALSGEVDTLTGQVTTLTTQRNTAQTALTAVTDKLVQALETAVLSPAATNDARVQALLGKISELSGQVDTLTGQVNTLTTQRDAAQAALVTEQDKVAARDQTIAFMTRQIDLMEAGGKKRDAVWFAQFDEIVANANSIGNDELATVFLGDGLIIEAVGGKTEAEIKTMMPNIPTARVHVAAMDGASVEEIKWGINNGWLPQKTAYTVIHAGRKEVEDNYAVLSTGADSVNAKAIGKKIGSIYPVVISKTTTNGGNPTSVIFSGIIPGNPINSDNIYYINGNDGIKYGDFGTAIDNSYIKMITPTQLAAFKGQANANMNGQPTYVATAMLKANGIFLANKKMDYKYFMAQANNRARVAFRDQRYG
jgi:outer membrane murein-binding lipoprotein Lpp